MILGKYIKQPAEIESYTITYEDDLTEGDVLSAVTASVAPDGLTLSGVNHDTQSERIWVSGGDVGVKYKITATVTTDDGRVLQDEFFVTIKDY